MFYHKTNKLNIFKLQSVFPKNIIYITPGGYYGFYQLGIAHYIKMNYDLKDYIYSGASAGSWVSLFMVYKGDSDLLIKNIFEYLSSKNKKSLSLIQKMIKTYLLNFNDSEFYLSKIYIGVVHLDCHHHFTTKIYDNFKTLEDAIDCCLGSSHIPLITGRLFYKYKKKLTFDGGFSNNPYLKKEFDDKVFYIEPLMWINVKDKCENNLFIKKNITLFEMYKL